MYIQLSRKVVGKNVHATIPKGNMGYDQYTVPDDCSCRTYFCCFPLALENTFPWPFVPILSNFFEERRTQNHPQCLLGLSRALFPTTFLKVAVYMGIQGIQGIQECGQSITIIWNIRSILRKRIKHEKITRKDPLGRKFLRLSRDRIFLEVYLT